MCSPPRTLTDPSILPSLSSPKPAQPVPSAANGPLWKPAHSPPRLFGAMGPAASFFRPIACFAYRTASGSCERFGIARVTALDACKKLDSGPQPETRTNRAENGLKQGKERTQRRENGRNNIFWDLIIACQWVSQELPNANATHGC